MPAALAGAGTASGLGLLQVGGVWWSPLQPKSSMLRWGAGSRASSSLSLLD